ncbi:glycosyltransferase [Candidatus Micrarchaeota archaeon]|nr:glycosyltransferase [Candidatus Micrarchaeota archaeon]
MVKRNNVKLSICIPTYNRAKFLPDALDSILNQITDENKDKVEICISDNCSTDNTEELIRSYQKKSPVPIVYHKNEKNMGADYNYLKVIDIAHGDFCWFLGSDDKMEPKAIDTVLLELLSNTEITLILVDRNEYDFDLKNKKQITYRLAGGKILENKFFSGKAELKDFLASFFYYLGYLSAEIINRTHWLSVIHNEKNISDYFHAYVHTYIITKMLLEHPKILFIPQALVGWRSNNDGFMDKNEGRYAKRSLLDVCGYGQIASDIIKPWDKRLYAEVCRSVATTTVRAHMMGIKKSNMPLKEKLSIWTKVIKAYWWLPGFWIQTFPFIIMPKPVFYLVRKAYRNSVK